MGFAAIAVPGWQASPGWVIGIAFLIFIAHRQGGAVSHVRIDHAIEELFAVVVVINKTVVVLITRNKTTAHVTRLYQRSLQIQHVALFVPATVTGGDIAFKFIAVCMLTYHVDVGGGISRAGHQAGCAAYHFNTIVNGGIGGGVAKVPYFADGGWKIIIRIVTDKEAARVKYRPVAVLYLRGDAGGVS